MNLDSIMTDVRALKTRALFIFLQLSNSGIRNTNFRGGEESSQPEALCRSQSEAFVRPIGGVWSETPIPQNPQKPIVINLASSVTN